MPGCFFQPLLLFKLSNIYINTHLTDPSGSLFFSLAIAWPSHSYPLNDWSWPREMPAHFSLVLFVKIQWFFCFYGQLHCLLYYFWVSTTHHPVQVSVWMVIRLPSLKGTFVRAMNSSSELTHNMPVPSLASWMWLFQSEEKKALSHILYSRKTDCRLRPERELLSH